MNVYAKRSLIYASAVIGITALVIYNRTDSCVEWRDWKDALDTNTSKGYRTYLAKWRLGSHANQAVDKWEQSLKNELKSLDWLYPWEVSQFEKDHPEFNSDDLKASQYKAVIKDGTYETLKRYYDSLSIEDPHKKEISDLIDALVMKYVQPAIDSNDYKRLRELSKEYSDWSKKESVIDRRINEARMNSAREEWTALAESRSEQELRRFASHYNGTTYAELAKKRIDALYDDFDFIKSKGSLRLYSDFVDKHPHSSRINEANQCIADELEKYVFKKKSLNYSDEALVKSLLSQYQQSRPYSGLLYGGSNYYTSPLQIKTPNYGGEDYFVKLVNKSTGRSVGIFVRNGATVDVEVPDGTYSVRYATGSQWYGTRFLFGLKAHYSRAGQDFTFRNGSGYTLTLQKVAHGNLHTSPMNASDF